MRNDQGDREYSETPPVRRCGYCGEPLLTQRRGAKWCSREHKELAREARKRASDRLTTLRKNHPLADTTLAELHERASAPEHWADLEAGRVDPELQEFSDINDVEVYEDQDDEPGIYSGGQRAPDSWQERNEAFGRQMALQEAIERIEADFERRSRPYVEQQRRNPGPMRPELAALMRERDTRIRELTAKFGHAAELERAARLVPQRVVTAHERELERAATRAFAMDLGGGRFLREDPADAGRDVHSAWIW